MKINTSAFSSIFLAALLCFSNNVRADIFQNNAFLYGHNIEVGIGPDGAFGSDVRSPDTTRKAFGKKLGYIVDPTTNRFSGSYHGDFFLPGFPEEGWGVGFNEKIYNNNSNQQGAEILGELLYYKNTAKFQRVVWEGEIEGLEITQIYRTYTSGTTVVFDISLKNTSATTMTNVYYMRTIDPDNNAEQAPSSAVEKFVTTNTIISQGSDGNGFSGVSAKQNEKSGLFTESLMTLYGYGENSRVTYGGLFNRDPEAVYSGLGLLKQLGSNTADEAISLAFKFDKLEPEDTVTFRASYQLKDVPAATIDIDTNNSSGGLGSEFKQLYILKSAASPITDTDITIEGDRTSQIEQAVITLTNPHNADILEVSGTLPNGISIDTKESSTTQVWLTGKASKLDYITALKQVTFNNNDIHSRIETRKVTVQILDDNTTPSNTAISTITVTIPVELSSPFISDDDNINKNEVNAVKLSGSAAPNATIIIDFTDKNGNKLAPAKTVTADVNGNWSIDADPADLSPLSDGPITVLVTATDANGNKASLTKTVIKDTAIILTNITPTDNAVVSNRTPIYKGKTDPNAKVTLKVLPNNNTYTTTADTNGDWSIALDKFPMGVNKPVQITATDNANNQISEITHFQTPTLPLEITDLDANNQGLANSTSPTLKGTSVPDTSITIDMPTGNGQSTKCNATTDANGDWSCQLPESPSGGPYTITVTTTDGEGNTNSATRQISIPELPLVIDNPTNNAVISGINPLIEGTSKPSTNITVFISSTEKCTTTTDDTNHWSCKLPSLAFGKSFTLTVTTEDSIANKTINSVDISTDKLPLSIIKPLDNSTAEDTTPVFIGTTTPNTTVTVSVATGQECTTTSDSKGNWSCELSAMAVGGPYDITIKAEDTNGNTTSIHESISIPAIPLIVTSPTSNEKITKDTINVTGTSDPNKPIKVLGPDGESCETVSDANGAWNCQLDKLQSGIGKHITVISDWKSTKKKIAIVTVDIENSSKKVKTILAGNASAFLLLLLGLLLLFRNKKLAVRTSQ